MIVFKNLKKAPKGTYPSGMLIKGSKGGTMTRDMMLHCFKKRQKKRQKKSLLIMDTARSVGSAFQTLETDAKYIDGRMTPLLQR